MKKAVLGRGLSALIPMENPQREQITPIEESLQTSLVSQLATEITNNGNKVGEYLTYQPTDSLTPNPYQPRIRFNEDKLKELSETIRKNGFIQYIIVRRNAGRYEIVSGERRWQACKMANIDSIPVIIKNYDDKSMLEAAIIENIELEDLNAVEIAKAIRALQVKFNLTQDEIADKLSKDRSTISNLLRLLSLSEDIQKYLLDGKIEFGHAKAILSVQNENRRAELASKIVEFSWSVRKSEEEARRMNAETSGNGKNDIAAVNEWEKLEQEFCRHLGTGVKVKLRKRDEQYRGTIEIQIHSKEDVDRILGVVRKGVIESRL